MASGTQAAPFQASRCRWWMWLQREEQRTAYRPEKGLEPRESWHRKTRWVRA
jgi:hypothetical protein